MSSPRTHEHSDTAVGFTVFAAVMLIMIGVFQGIAALVALFNDTFFVVGEEYLFKFDVSTWGWIHLIVAILLIAAGVFLFRGALWARIVGVIVATISAVVNFAWLPWYPIWGAIMIAVDVLVIWALTAHGRDITQA